MALKEKEKAKRNQQHTFQPGHPRQYYCVSNALSFGERTGSGVFHVEMADSVTIAHLRFYNSTLFYFYLFILYKFDVFSRSGGRF